MCILSQIKKLFTKRPRIIVVLGQTSTGKSDLAVEIAQKYNGEIISADSRQVYSGMDLGSGKVTREEMRGIPHHMLDVANPGEIFDVQRFQKLGTQKIQEILERGKTPIICGGTGFYIDSLIYKTKFSSVQPNIELRKELEKKSLPELQNILKQKSPKTAQSIDMENPVRIIRALEIVEEIGYIPKVKKNNPYKVLSIGLTMDKEKLDKRIYLRIIKRLDNGMLDEIHSLLKNGVSHERLQKLGLEYRYMSKHTLGEISHDEMIDQLYRDTVKFAKRQRTWFKRNKKTIWFDSFENRTKMFQIIEEFLKQKTP